MSDKKKVVVAMSGGVDSSVAAALLVDQGFDVTGVMLKLWADDCGEKDNSCCPPEAIAQAREVASLLGIPFYVLDTQELFKKRIVDTFIQAYGEGLTPNPCFNCNRWIRWGFLLDFAMSNGNDFLATGHYARLVNDETGVVHLHKGLDETKDQSYVLSGLDQKQLMHTLLPLGELKKVRVRELARAKGLPVAEKHDSQDLCFAGRTDYRDFLKRHSPELFREGEIVDIHGKTVGHHQGLANFTIGQRKGLGAGNEEPIYVVRKELDLNQLMVGNKNELGVNTFTVRNLHLIAGTLNAQQKYQVKTRYKAAPVTCTIKSQDANDLRVSLEKSVPDVTPGQVAVFYDGSEVMASGMIADIRSGR